MTATPLTTIADALIEFILSLLRDPSAAQEFSEDPDESLNRAGLGNVCGEDVRSVVPVVVDHPDVVVRPPAPQPIIVHVPGAPAPSKPDVVREITTIANNFHIDNRSTIVDQSVNQNIWAEGDVTQIFDQEAVFAVGDGSMAAGDDAVHDESNTDVTMGDVSIGNTTTDVSIEDSFNDESIDVAIDTQADVDESFNDSSTDVAVDTEIDDSFNETETTDIAVDTEVVNNGNIESPAAVVESTVMAPEPMEVEEPEVDYSAFVEAEPPMEMELEETN